MTWKEGFVGSCCCYKICEGAELLWRKVSIKCCSAKTLDQGLLTNKLEKTKNIKSMPLGMALGGPGNQWCPYPTDDEHAAGLRPLL